MQRSRLVAALSSFALAACGKSCSPSPPMVSAPTVPPAGVVETPVHAAPGPSGDGPNGGAAEDDAGADPRFRACRTDADCAAVDRVGCCHNGWKEGVASLQKDAYARSFVCPEAHPICPMYIVRDLRIPKCDERAHLCTMAPP
jgi:hypothetical protein